MVSGFALEVVAVLSGADNAAALSPNLPELCNGRDDNCDGVVDENCGSTETETLGTVPSPTPEDPGCGCNLGGRGSGA